MSFQPDVEHSVINRICNFIVGFIYSFHMPLFMCLSGMAFKLSFTPTTSSFFPFIHKKAKRLLLPFILVTIFFAVPLKYISGYYDGSDNILSDILLGQVFLLGNSHLWFIVSLFWISVTYYFLQKQKMTNNVWYWGIATLLSYIGIYIQAHSTELFGFAGMFKNLLFFSFGYVSYDYFNTHSFSWRALLLSWIMMLIVYILSYKNIYFAFATRVPVALWGCANMLTTSKKISDNLMFIQKPAIYKSLKKNSYDLYLYSDPFNYILIYLFVSLWGENIFTDNAISGIAFLLRIFLSTILAYGVILIINSIKPSFYLQRAMSLQNKEK